MNERTDVVRLSFMFSLMIVDYCEKFESIRKFTVAKQLFRSGTAIGAMVKEAQGAESRKDFVHKMKIASKEAHETDYWLEICEKSKNYPICDELKIQVQSLIRILGKIISTSIHRLSN